MGQGNVNSKAFLAVYFGPQCEMQLLGPVRQELMSWCQCTPYTRPLVSTTTRYKGCFCAMVRLKTWLEFIKKSIWIQEIAQLIKKHFLDTKWDTDLEETRKISNLFVLRAQLSPAFSYERSFAEPGPLLQLPIWAKGTVWG